MWSESNRMKDTDENAKNNQIKSKTSNFIVTHPNNSPSNLNITNWFKN